MVVYDHDFNAILSSLFKIKSFFEKLQSTQEIHEYLNVRGIYPKMHVIDNECLQAVKNYIVNLKKLTYSLHHHICTKSMPQRKQLIFLKPFYGKLSYSISNIPNTHMVPFTSISNSYFEPPATS